jgi:predicted nucleic acid-binding Zn ribbon protein
VTVATPPKQKACLVCGELIPRTRRSDAIYCSPRCSAVGYHRKSGGVPVANSSYKRRCEVCGKPVERKIHSPRLKYCSESCSALAHSRRQHDQPVANRYPDRRCPVCGKAFLQRPGVRYMTYCSPSCRVIASRRRKQGLPEEVRRHPIACRVCGKRFEQRDSRNKYCSGQCRDKAKLMRQTPLRVCQQCGSPLPSDARSSQRFCSYRCQSTHWSREYRARRRETINRRQNERHGLLRQRVLQAYGSQCQCCGQTDPELLAVDHIAGTGRIERGTREGQNFYHMLERKGFPQDRYRLLCFNCNAGREFNGGVCPHEGHQEQPEPLKCIVCGREATDRQPVCASCRRVLKEKHGNLSLPACLQCGTPLLKRDSGQRYFCAQCARERKRASAAYSRRKDREAAISHYGGRCAECGEEELLFLTIDHVSDDGAAHRQRVGPVINRWLRQNSYPSGFQVLCYNCNLRKGIRARSPRLRQP